MQSNLQQTTTLPETKDFLIWVKRSIADLDMRPAHFLNDEGRPGSVNRVSNIYKNPAALKLADAKRLEREIREIAKERGVELLPLKGGTYWQEAS